MNLDWSFSANFSEIKITNFNLYSGRVKLLFLLKNWLQYLPKVLDVDIKSKKFVCNIAWIFHRDVKLNSITLPRVSIAHNNLVRYASRQEESVLRAYENTLWDSTGERNRSTDFQIVGDFTKSALMEAIGPYLRKNTLHIPEVYSDMSCNMREAMEIAKDIYHNKPEESLHGVLADALDDSGFKNRAIIDHLRQKHITSRQPCWAVSALMGEHPAAY